MSNLLGDLLSNVLTCDLWQVKVPVASSVLFKYKHKAKFNAAPQPATVSTQDFLVRGQDKVRTGLSPMQRLARYRGTLERLQGFQGYKKRLHVLYQSLSAFFYIPNSEKN